MLSILCLAASYPTYSQIDTSKSDSIVCIEADIAREIVKDLIRLDECVEIATKQDSIIADLQTVNENNDVIINNFNEIVKANNNTINSLQSTIDLKNEVITETTNDLNKAKRWNIVFGTVSAISVSSLVLLSLIL